MSATGLIVRIKPTAGQPIPINEIGGGEFAGTGTPTLTTVDGVTAWAITAGTSLLLSATKSTNSNDGGGITIAARLRVRNYGSTADAPLIGMTSNATTTSTAGGCQIRRFGTNGYSRTTYGTGTAIAGYNALTLNIIQTIVFTVSMKTTTNSDQGLLWYNRTDRSGTAPDATSTAGNYVSLSFINAFINSGAGMEYDILDFCAWNRELTEVEAAAVADNIRGAIDGGTAPTGTVTIGTITPNSTGASVPFTYSAADQTGFEYRLNGGAAVTGTTSPQVLTGLTPSTAYTIEIRAVNASGAGAWSASANFTTSASVVPIAFTGTIPNQTFTDGQAVSVDLSSYFSGTQTPFTFSNTGTALTDTGLTISSAGLLSGAATTGSVTGVIVTGTDADLNTASSNAFNVTVNPASDVTAPAFTVAPAVTIITQTGGTATATIDELGSIFYVVVPQAESTPSGPQVIAGQNAAGGAPIDSGNAVDTTTLNDPFTGLTAGAAYKACYIARDDEPTPNVQANVTVVNFNAAAAPVGTFTTGVLRRLVGGGIVASTTMTYFRLYDPVTGALVLNRTDLSSDANGRVTCTDAALTAGVEYKADWLAATGETRMSKKAAT